MASLDGSPMLYSGQSWAEWDDHVSLGDVNDNPDVNHSCNDSMKLHKGDMRLFGLCPARDEFFLVVCEKCGQVIKPQAIKQHTDFHSSGRQQMTAGRPPVSKTSLSMPRSTLDPPKLSPSTGPMVVSSLKTKASVKQAPNFINQHKIADAVTSQSDRLNSDKLNLSLTRVKHNHSIPVVEVERMSPSLTSKQSVSLITSEQPLRTPSGARSPGVSLPVTTRDLPKLFSAATITESKEINDVVSVAVSVAPFSSSSSSPLSVHVPSPVLIPVVTTLGVTTSSTPLSSYSTTVLSIPKPPKIALTAPALGVAAVTPVSNGSAFGISNMRNLCPRLATVVTTAINAPSVNISTTSTTNMLMTPISSSKHIPVLTTVTTATVTTASSMSPVTLTTSMNSGVILASPASKAGTVTLRTPHPAPPKRLPPKDSKSIPCRLRTFEVDKHCGVILADTGKPCTRSLTCKSHALSLRRSVKGRSKSFDDLLLEHRDAKEALLLLKKQEQGDTGAEKTGSGTKPSKSMNKDQKGGGSSKSKTAVPATTAAGTIIPTTISVVVCTSAVTSPKDNATTATVMSPLGTGNRLSPAASPSLPSPVMQLSPFAKRHKPFLKPLSAAAHRPSQSHLQSPPPLLTDEASHDIFSRLSSDGETEEKDVKTECSHLNHHPRPAAVCTFGARQAGSGMFMFQRKTDYLRDVFLNVLDRHLHPPPYKKLCVESNLPKDSHIMTNAIDPYAFDMLDSFSASVAAHNGVVNSVSRPPSGPVKIKSRSSSVSSNCSATGNGPASGNCAGSGVLTSAGSVGSIAGVGTIGGVTSIGSVGGVINIGGVASLGCIVGSGGGGNSISASNGVVANNFGCVNNNNNSASGISNVTVSRTVKPPASIPLVKDNSGTGGIISCATSAGSGKVLWNTSTNVLLGTVGSVSSVSPIANSSAVLNTAKRKRRSSGSGTSSNIHNRSVTTLTKNASLNCSGQAPSSAQVMTNLSRLPHNVLGNISLGSQGNPIITVSNLNLTNAPFGQLNAALSNAAIKQSAGQLGQKNNLNVKDIGIMLTGVDQSMVNGQYINLTGANIMELTSQAVVSQSSDMTSSLALCNSNLNRITTSANSNNRRANVTVNRRNRAPSGLLTKTTTTPVTLHHQQQQQQHQHLSSTKIITAANIDSLCHLPNNIMSALPPNAILVDSSSGAVISPSSLSSLSMQPNSVMSLSGATLAGSSAISLSGMTLSGSSAMSPPQQSPSAMPSPLFRSGSVSPHVSAASPVPNGVISPSPISLKAFSVSSVNHMTNQMQLTAGSPASRTSTPSPSIMTTEMAANRNTAAKVTGKLTGAAQFSRVAHIQNSSHLLSAPTPAAGSQSVKLTATAVPVLAPALPSGRTSLPITCTQPSAVLAAMNSFPNLCVGQTLSRATIPLKQGSIGMVGGPGSVTASGAKAISMGKSTMQSVSFIPLMAATSATANITGQQGSATVPTLFLATDEQKHDIQLSQSTSAPQSNLIL